MRWHVKPHNAFIRIIGLLILIIILLNIDYNLIYAALLKVNTFLYISTFVLILFIYFLKAIRWKVLLYIQGINYSFKNCFVVFFSSNYLAFITPGRVGEIAKAFYLKNDLRIPFSKALPTVILDRFFDIYMLLILGIWGFLKFSLSDNVNAYLILILLAMVVVPWFFLSRKISLPIIKSILSIPFLNRYKDKVYSSSVNFFDQMRNLLDYRLIYAAILTFFAYLVLFGIAYVICIACQLDIGFFTIVFFVSVANILSFLPISFAGIGTREASFIYLFSLVNISTESALLFSTLFFITFFIVGGLYGFIFFTIKPIKINT